MVRSACSDDGLITSTFETVTPAPSATVVVASHDVVSPLISTRVVRPMKPDSGNTPATSPASPPPHAAKLARATTEQARARMIIITSGRLEKARTLHE